MTREIGSDGLDIMKERTPEPERDVPCWHACVGDGWRPVLFGESLLANDELLTAGGWRPTNDDGGYFLYAESMPPRRRRKPCIYLYTRKNGCAYGYTKTVKPGQCFVVSTDGELLPIDKQGDD